MKTIYLKEYEEMAKKGVAYIPVGTLEWHGHHLPLETDYLVAEKVCQILEKDFPGYILPPIYLGTYGTKIIDGKEMRGMDKRLKKELPGNLYFLKPELFKKMLEELVENLEKDGFNKIIIASGHGGTNQIATIKGIAESNSKVLAVDLYGAVDEVEHADEGETSIYWACYPEEEARSRAVEIGDDDDFFKYHGYDPRVKSSIELGKKYLDKMISDAKGNIEKFL